MLTPKKVVSFIQEDISERGIFFRFPFVKVSKDNYYGNDNMESANGWYQRAKKWFIPRLYNLHVYRNCLNWFNDGDCCGIHVWELISPIYFKRVVKTAEHHLEHPLIDKIKVWAEEPYMNSCGGSVIVEKTIIHFKNGKKKKIETKGSSNYHYNNMIEQTFFDKEAQRV